MEEKFDFTNGGEMRTKTNGQLTGQEWILIIGTWKTFHYFYKDKKILIKN